jgi:O-methyltransferase involved in polyketide biosynthesis
VTDDVHLDAVSETLFLPLYALALESQRPSPIMVDEGAVDLTRRLNALFADSDKRLYRRLANGRLPSALLTSMSLRIRQYDRYVTTFLEREPGGVVVNLGCGLDDRRRRVNNGRVRWYDLDLPEVIAFRRRFLPETDRMRFIASSVLDFTWFDELPDEPGPSFLFVAEGLFMYLPPGGVRSLVTMLGDRYPGAELVAEIANRRIVRIMQGRLGRGKFRRQFGLSQDVVYTFGLGDSREIESWAPGLTFLDDWTYFDEMEPKLGWMRWFARWPLFRWAQWTVHYRLGTKPEL